MYQYICEQISGFRHKLLNRYLECFNSYMTSL